MSRKIKWISIVLALVMLVLSINVSPVVGSPGETVRVWVQYKPGQSSTVLGILRASKAQIHYTFSDLDSFVVSLPSKALEGILKNPSVLGVEEDVERYPFAPMQHIPMSEVLSLTTDSIDANGQTVPWGIDAVQARDVWDANRDGAVDQGAPTGSGRTVCIIDTGYYQDHEDLPSAVGGYSQVDDNWARDGYGHGTHVAGTIDGLNNAKGVVGVSPGEISLYIVKYFNDDGAATMASDLVDAINRCADNGANIISMSLGGSRSNGLEKRAFNNLYAQGILHIAAAGNAGDTSYSYPASYDSVVSVAAIDESKLIANFSQQNDQVEIAAPGVNVLSTVPFLNENKVTVDGVTYDANHIEYAAHGTANGALADGGLCDSTGNWSGNIVLCERGVISFYDKVMNVQNSGGAAVIIYNNEPGGFLGTLGEGNSSEIIGLSMSQEDGLNLINNYLGTSASLSSSYNWPASGYEAWNGTSMATPHVSAVAALLWSSDTTLSNVDIREAMNATAYDLGTAGRDNAYGNGLVQAYDALQYLGGGSGTDNPPSIDITNPLGGETVAGTVVITADASDDVGVAQVEFLIDDTTISADEDGSDGWSVSWDTTVFSDGGHTITASATDTIGQTVSDSVSVTVDNNNGGATIDLSVLAYKVRGSLYADLTWSGATSDNVDIYRDGVLITTTTNDGFETDATGQKGGGNATYQVCEEGTTTCSNEVAVNWQVFSTDFIEAKQYRAVQKQDTWTALF